MATFNKIDRQQVYSFPAYHSLSSDEQALVLNVGDVFSRNVSTNEIAKLSTAAEAISAKDGGKEIYIVAQGDDVTLKTGTAYKTYKLGKTVAVPSESTAAKIVAGYRVDGLDNLVW